MPWFAIIKVSYTLQKEVSMLAQTDDYKQRYVGKYLPVKCIENDPLDDLDIKNNCFALLIIHEGSVSLQVGERILNAMSPCLICLDETKEVKLRRKRHLVCDSIYFHPTFLNINMTFDRVHSPNYEALANIHDLFLLSPFTGGRRPILPMLDENQTTMRFLFSKIMTELNEQPDWYYPCRSRSYFIEIMILLERIYDFVGGRYVEVTEKAEEFENPNLQKAVAFIEAHHSENITLQDIVKACSVNHSTMTKLFKEEFGLTPIAYLWDYRITVSKKLLEFTNLPVKEIATRCGFKTVQHFSRKFEEQMGISPAVFRTQALARRRASF
ncbi:MAG: helix-turn-helix domain-containing protein [Ruminococcaceae bacterium]|nr:helix-turn-helix domain-containing protein [Oscillospiraceae bacterium]